MTEKEFFDIDINEEKIDIKAILYKYLRYWPLIATCIFISFLMVFVFLKTKSNTYIASAKIQIIDDSQETPNFSLDLKGLLGKSKVNLDNEIAVLKSYQIIENVVKRLDLNVAYFAKGNFVKKQIFSPPFKVRHILPVDSIKEAELITINITNKGYVLTKTTEEGVEYKKEVNDFNYRGDLPGFPIIIQTIKDYETHLSDITYTVLVNTVLETTKSYIKHIAVGPSVVDGDLLDLSIETHSELLSKNIINTLIDVYEEDGIKDRQLVFKRTIEFVDERFKYLASELEAIEVNKKKFKQDNKVSMFATDAGIAVQKNAIKNDELFQIETQLELAKLLEGALKNGKENELLPSDIGVKSEAINRLIVEFNSNLLEYEKTKLSAGANNPYLKVLKANLIEFKSNINKSVKGYLTQLQKTKNRVEKSQIIAENYFQELPEKEKTLRRIDRQQNLKESLYLLLLQKREESAINYAVTASDLKVIDYAIVKGPITPSKGKFYFMAIIVGGILPVLVLYVKFLLNTSIVSAKDIELITKDTPILSHVPLLKNSDYKIDHEGDRGGLKESFRTLVTNINFVIPSKTKGDGNVLLVTSTIKGEGKTTVSYNLATELATHNKKIILIGADLRNPQLHKYLDSSNTEEGLSTYLGNNSIEVSDLSMNKIDGFPSLDVLLSGAVPPNPTALLSNNRFENLITELKKEYDTVVIDSAPTMLVSDTLIFTKYADVTLFVVRSNYTDKKLVEFSKRLSDEKKVNNLGYVLNGVELNSDGYGYNYSYSYEQDFDDKPKKWYQFFKKS